MTCFEKWGGNDIFQCFLQLFVNPNYRLILTGGLIYWSLISIIIYRNRIRGKSNIWCTFIITLFNVNNWGNLKHFNIWLFKNIKKYLFFKWEITILSITIKWKVAFKIYFKYIKGSFFINLETKISYIWNNKDSLL